MKLVAVFPQYKDGNKDKLVSDVNIEVDYDPEERVVTEVISVKVYNYKMRVFTEMTDFFDTFSKLMDGILESVDWWEEYISQRQKQRAA